MSRERSNWMMTEVDPWLLVLVSSLMPAIWPMARSRGVATVAAIVSGEAPARDARTMIVGMSIWGSGATGRNR